MFVVQKNDNALSDVPVQANDFEKVQTVVVY